VNRTRFARAIAIAALTTSAAAADTPAPATARDPLEAVTAGTLTFNLRPRFEYVDQDGKSDTAEAFTLRTLLGWRTRPFHGVSLYAEAIDVTRLGPQHFNDSAVASTRYPTVADPGDTDINQLYVDYAGVTATRIRFGRQSLKLDNVRHIGNVEFRQVMQVLTGLWVENRTIPGVELDYGHFVRVKNVFDLQRQTRLDLARAAWTFLPDNVIAGYGYFQDQAATGQVTGFADNSNRILGVRANGAVPIDATWKLPYTAEFAKQDAYADGNAAIDARYWRAGLGVQWNKTFVRLDREVLGSNDGLYAFQTPLGTNHLFQGWADQFLTTPRQGIRDTYASAGTTVAGTQLYTEYHHFRSDIGDAKLGTEWDVGATYVFTKHVTGKVEAARFREGDPQPTRFRDTTRVWVTAVISY